MSKLFTPLNVGSLQLSHRLVSPLGMHDRHRGGVHPLPSVDEYAERARAGGLLITGPCRISAQGAGQPGYRGLDAAEDVREWRRITDAVHANGGLVVAQLSHAGNAAHSSLNGEGPVSASSVRVARQVVARDGSWVDAEAPRALDQEGIDAVLDDYRRAALAARDAGFDAVELTATTGSLPGQFLLDSTNVRTDDYGGAVSNRITFLAQAVETLCAVWTPGRVGVRLSPWDEPEDSDAPELFVHAVETLGDQEIAYLNFVKEDASATIELEPGSDACRLVTRFRSAFPSALFFCGRYELATALACVDRRIADAMGLYESSLDIGFVDRTLRTAQQLG